MQTLRRYYFVAASLALLIVLGLPGGLLRTALADATPQSLPFTQNWTNIGLITANDNWSGVPGIEGFLGQDLTTAIGADPQTILTGSSSVAGDLTVLANQTNPNTQTAGDVAEFHTTLQAAPANANPTIALQGSATADAPNIVITLNTTARTNINVAYNLRDIDGSADNAVQPVALQFRVGTTGNYTNLPAGFVADAATGPSLATLVTPVSVTLPAAAENQPVVQVRVITTNATGSDEWIGVDDIVVNVTPSLIISEFRTFGPTGTCDEFVEIYNALNIPFTVQSADAGSLGFGVAQSNGNVLFIIENGVTIPARGHYLAVNNGCGPGTGSFSGSGYPAGSPAATATGDDTMNEDIPANAGIAIFNTSNQAGFNTTNRLDAVGPTTAPALYVEGTGYPAIIANTNSYSLYRDARSGVPQDTNNNVTDFRIADTGVNPLCASNANFQCQRLGAPGPENLSSPVQRNAEIKASLVDTQCSSIRVNPTLTPGVYQPSACRFERRTDAASGFGASPTSTGTLSIRRRFTNNTGVPVTRLRFRIVDITTFPDFVATPGTADLRAITSATVTAFCQDEAGTPHQCTDNASLTTTIEGTTLETDANGQPNSGAFNSTLSLGTPLAAGASVNVQFLLGVERNGTFRFFINVEALPAPTGGGPIANEAGAATKAQATGKARAVKGSK